MSRAARAAALALLAGACAWALFRWVYLPYDCNVSISDVRGGTTEASVETKYEAIELVRLNLAQLRRLEHQCATNVHVYALAAANHRLLGDNEAALDDYKRALAIDRRPELYREMGNVLTSVGRFDEAVDTYFESARFSAEQIEQIPGDEAKRRVQERLRARAAAQKP